MVQKNNSPNPLPRSLDVTLAVLSQVRYQAGTKVLAHGLESQHQGIRHASLLALLARGRKEDFAAVLSHIDGCGPQELDALRPHVPKMLLAIDQGVISRDPLLRHCSLWMVGKFALHTHFSFLVDAVCDPEDPQQLVATELLSQLARTLGQAFRNGDLEASEKREQLVIELLRGLDSYGVHRVQQMFDWLGAALHWDDPNLASMLGSREATESNQRIIAYFGRTKSKESLELLAGFLWSRNANDAMLKLAGNRTDGIYLEILAAQFRRLGSTRELNRNLTQSIAFRFFEEQQSNEDEPVSLTAKCCVAELMTLKSAPAEDILPRIGWLLANGDKSIQEDLTALIEHQRPVHPQVAILALNDSLDAPDIESSVPPPWKESLRRALETIIAVYPHQENRMRYAISNLFRDFHCETLLEKLLDWPTGHLLAYARLIRLAQPSFADEIISELKAQSPQRRLRGVQAARYFGLDQAMWGLVAERIEDPVDEVRIEAIHALADSDNPQEAIALIRPLISEPNPVIQQAASITLQNLGGWQ